MVGAAPADEQRRLAEERVQAAARLRQVEDQAAALAEQVGALEQGRLEAERRLAERAAALGPLLPLAERLALYPAETLLAVPGSPANSVRGLLVLRGLSRTLERDAAELRTAADAAAASERDIGAVLPKLRAQQSEQTLQAAQLDRQIAAAAAMRARADDAAADAARRMAANAARAETLRGALFAMGAGRPPTAPRTAAAAMLVPVSGPVARRWGERTDAGPLSGMSLRAPPSGRVVAPCGGRAVFAGPFRSFGRLIILDCGGGIDVVLAGLDRLDVQVGVTVQEGEPVGVMPAWDPASPPPHPALYMEIRRDGQAIDPAPFLRARS